MQNNKIAITPVWRRTYSKNYTNAEILAGGHEVFQDQTAAGINANLPHNTLIIVNKNTTCTVFIFLDDFSAPTKPDYIVFPSQQMVVPVEDGVRFSTLFIKNTHGANAIAAGEINITVGTAKRQV